MERTATPGRLQPLDDEVDHVRGGAAGRLILEYGDYECPYSRQAFREIERIERRLSSGIRFAFRHFPLTEIHPHALTAGRPAPVCRPARARRLTLRPGPIQPDVLGRIRRDVESGLASGEVRGTPTLFIDGTAHHRGYDAATLMEALGQMTANPRR